MDKLISQQAAIDALNTQAEEMSHWSERYQEQRRGVLTAVNIVADCQSVQPNHCAEVGKKVLIDRQEALEAIGTLQTYKLFSGDDMLLIDQAEAQTELMMLPTVQPERKIGRWIPCSERQPDKGDDYLVTLWDDGRTWVEIALWNETFGGRWQAVLYNDVDYSDISNVIAWMPLPEYYQKKDGDSE